MANLMNRMKSGLQRMGDWVSGHDVDVAGQAPEAELLESRATARPLVDVLEADDELMLVADVPGAYPDSTHVHLDSGRLTILARVPSVADAHLLLGGVADTNWYAEFTLPDAVDPERVYASLREGVLTVRLPKRERPQARRITVMHRG